MELTDYTRALRRHWATWVGGAMVGLLIALAAGLVIPTTFSASATVFVSSRVEGTDGSAFVNQRVASYPDVALSQTVLLPVAQDLGLPYATVRAHVTSVNPVNTSQITITATDSESVMAADIANEVASRFGRAVEALESSENGSSPVRLTVTNPAIEPRTPSEPRATLLLALGLVAGLFLGLAAAVLRSRLDRTVQSEVDIRRALAGEWDELAVLTGSSGGRSTTGPTDRVVAELARRIDLLGDERPGHVVLLPPSDDTAAATDLARVVVGGLRAKGVDAVLDTARQPTSQTLAPPGTGAAVSDGAIPVDRTEVTIGSPMTALRSWRLLHAQGAGVVVVIQDGITTDNELRDVAGVLRAVDIAPLALVLLPRSRRRRKRARRDARDEGRTPTIAGVSVPASPPVMASPTEDSRTPDPRVSPTGPTSSDSPVREAEPSAGAVVPDPVAPAHPASTPKTRATMPLRRTRPSRTA